MRTVLETARAVALAAPLALAAAPATANEFAGSMSSGMADLLIDATKNRTERAVSAKPARIKTKAAVPQDTDFRAEVRYYLEREKCYVLSNPSKNAPTWLSAIAKFDSINERAPKNYGKKTAAAIEKAKSGLEAERQKAKVPFATIMDEDRPMSAKERECLSGKGRTKI